MLYPIYHISGSKLEVNEHMVKRLKEGCPSLKDYSLDKPKPKKELKK